MNTVSLLIGAIGLTAFLGLIFVLFAAAYIDYQRERDAQRVPVEADR